MTFIRRLQRSGLYFSIVVRIMLLRSARTCPLLNQSGVRSKRSLRNKKNVGSVRQFFYLAGSVAVLQTEPPISKNWFVSILSLQSAKEMEHCIETLMSFYTHAKIVVSAILPRNDEQNLRAMDINEVKQNFLYVGANIIYLAGFKLLYSVEAGGVCRFLCPI